MEIARTAVEWIRHGKYAAHCLLLAVALAIIGGAWAWRSPPNRGLPGGAFPADQIAQRGVNSPDQAESAPPSDSASPGDEPVLRVYRCPAGQAEEVANSLRAEFGSAPGSRIVPEQRTSQVLVVASPAVQAQISRRLGRAQPAAAVARPAQARDAAGPGSPASESPRATFPAEIQLRNSTADQIEAALLGALGNRLEPLPSDSRDLARYRMTLRDDTAVDLSLDRRSHRIRVVGASSVAGSVAQLIRVLDTRKRSADESTDVVPLAATRPADARRTIEAIRTANGSRQRGPTDQSAQDELGPLVNRLAQQDRSKATPEGEKERKATTEAPAAKTDQPPGPDAAPGTGRSKVLPPEAQVPGGPEQGGGLIGPVEIQIIEGLDLVIIRGSKRDVEMVRRIIEEIETLSKLTEPAIEIHVLQHVDCVTMATVVNQVYQAVYFSRQGTVLLMALVRPNALLIVGRKENVDRAIDLAKKLDSPGDPQAMFKVFFLKHATAVTVQSTIVTLYPSQQAGFAPGAAAAAAAAGGLAPQVRVIADFRANALVVQASPRDLAEIEALITRLDTKDIETVNQMRIFQLKHIMAQTAASILDSAVRVQGGAMGVTPGAAPGAFPGAGTGFAPGGVSGAAGLGTRAGANQRSAMLQLVTIDPKGQQVLRSGVLTDVQFTANPQANTLMVSAPEESMALIATLIQQLDQPPAVRAEIKVFEIKNGDASVLATMLDQFFGTTATAGAAGGMQPALQTAATPSETSLVPLRFNVDMRTNTIIAAGTYSDLIVVEAILRKLEGGDAAERITKVYELKNRPALAIYTAINGFLSGERTLQNLVPNGGFFSALDWVEREVIVIPETVSNSLIVSVTPRLFKKIDKLINDLDKRPPMVMVQVLMVGVDLTDTDEFGVELGLQDTLLFNRGLPATGGGLTPGFAFNNQPLGNNNVGTQPVGTQGLSSFAMGRTGGLGYGGLVFSASSENVSILIRALKENRRLEVMACPKVQTLDNQTAYVQVGQQLPYILSVSQTAFGQSNEVTLIPSGLILAITPRISPDGMVVMEVNAQRSEPGPESEGIPIFVSPNGTVIREPKIDITQVETTVAAPDGQTVVLGGLISKGTSNTRRKVPGLGDVPFFGALFRYDQHSVIRRELLIILTPRVIRNDEDAEAVKRTEAARMHWCLSDVIDVWGSEGGLRGRKDDWSDDETQVVYPDAQPGVPGPRAPANGAKRPQNVPTPAKLPPLPQGDNSPQPPEGDPRPNDKAAWSVDLWGRDANRAGSAPAGRMPAYSGPSGPVTPARYDSVDPWAANPLRDQ